MMLAALVASQSSSAVETALPRVIKLGKSWTELAPLVRTDCERIEAIHHSGPTAAPFARQTQVNCFGLPVFGAKRRVELMFNDGPLGHAWVLARVEELNALRQRLAHEFGPVVYSGRGYDVFERGGVALRTDPPEVLIATQALLRELTGFGGVVSDPRDGRRYAVVDVGGRNWLGRNLAFGVQPSWCFGGADEECESGGRLYPWESAMQACLPGWRLSTEQDWIALERALDMDESALEKEGPRGTNQGVRMRSGGDSGLDVLMTGYRRPDGSFVRRGERAAFWTSTEDDAAAAWHRDIRLDTGTVYRSSVPKDYALSVRCVQEY